MTIALYIVAGLIGAYALWLVTFRLCYGVRKGRYNKLSWPAKKIMKDYIKIPKRFRPYPNIYAMLFAIDTKYERKKVTQHFSTYGYEGGRIFKWCGCLNTTCVYPEYKQIHKATLDIYSTIEAQEKERRRNKELAKVGADLEDAESLAENLSTRAKELKARHEV